MARFTPEYATLQKELHGRGSYGTSGAKHADRVLELSQKLKTRDVLDYACGQGWLQKSLPFPIQQYDPFIQGFDSEPGPADIVVCSDVLEHIEPECLSDVLEHLRGLTQKVILLDIATRPAKKFLADGRNAHLIQQHHCWWVDQIYKAGLDPHSFQTYGGGVVMLATPVPL